MQFPTANTFRAHRCSRLTRQHGGEQSGLVTLTFDPESGVRVTCDYLATSVPILVFVGLCSRLRPDVRVRQTSDSIIA